MEEPHVVRDMADGGPHCSVMKEKCTVMRNQSGETQVVWFPRIAELSVSVITPDDNNDGDDKSHLSIYLSITVAVQFKAHTFLERTKETYGIPGSNLDSNFVITGTKLAGGVDEGYV